MLSKPKIAYIRSLHNKSTRLSEGIFLVEGRKSMTEFLVSDFEIIDGFFTSEFLPSLSLRHAVEESLSKSHHENKNIIISKLQEKGISTIGQKIPFPHSIVTENELSRITTLTSNDSGLLLVKMRENRAPKIKTDELVLILDRINDPGNLGTIIRIADWYGISHIVASRDTVDCYNPKVIMATMGSLSRVSIFYTDLEEYLSLVSQDSVIPGLTRDPVQLKTTESGFLPSTREEGQTQQECQTHIYGAYLNGDNIHTKKWSSQGGYLVIGSEAHGISENLERYITDKITIPRFGLAESLNAGVATAVILDRMRGEGV